MKLDEAIAHCEEIVQTNYALYDTYMSHGEQGEHVEACLKCASEHRQLADWLKLLKRIVDSGDCNICGIRNVCQIKPNLGEQVRYNCPLFVKEESE